MYRSRKLALRRLDRSSGAQDEASRLFFALWPDDATRRALARLSRSLHERCGGREVPPANVHLTLVFLGNVEAQRVPALTRMAADVQGSTIDLALDAVGYWRHNRIVWIGAQVCPETLHELVRQLVAGVRDLGMLTESREYAPHITLLRKAQRGPAGNDMTAIEWHATEFMLMRSIPHEGSVAYEVIGHWPLARRA